MRSPAGASPPADARRLLRKLEFHYTPKHGNWLNQAEIELSVLANQCLDRRLDSIEAVRREPNSIGSAQHNHSDEVLAKLRVR